MTEEDPKRTRKANGEGSIFEDAKGVWHAYVSMGVRDNGKPDRRHVQGKNRPAVVAKVDALKKQRDTGNSAATGKKYRTGEWLLYWLENIAARKVRSSTMNSYRTLTTGHLVPGLGEHWLHRLRPDHIETLYSRMEDQELSASTRLQTHRILSRALTVAMQRGHVGRNVATLVDAPSVEHEEVEPLSAADSRAIMDAVRVRPVRRNGARWSVALALGFRQGETLGLRWSNVDMKVGAIRPKKQLQRSRARHGCGVQPAPGEPWPCGMKQPIRCPKAVGGGLVFVPLKSRAGRRTVAAPRPLVEALADHRAMQDEEREMAGDAWVAKLDFGTGKLEPNDLVFSQANGRPIDPRQDWAAWKAVLHSAGVRDARLHDARHTAASLLMAQGVPARVVMEILGHSQVSLTLGTYSHVSPELSHGAADLMGEALWGRTATKTATALDEEV